MENLQTVVRDLKTNDEKHELGMKNPETVVGYLEVE